jgi:CRISPR-associated exonuclease Cas4
MFSEDELLPISALQHLLFCERQCALIHIERLWVENRLTAEGRVLHRNAHEGPDETRHGVRTTRGLGLRSTRLGLVGVADVVEFRQIDGEEGMRRPFPIEYKRGKPKAHNADLVQLCAQALCLEEMFETPVEVGAIFYGEPRRRLEVRFDSELRDLTARTAVRLHALIASGVTPRAVRERKCDACSLLPVCLPEAMTRGSVGVSAYVDQALDASLDADQSKEPIQ